MADLYSAVTPLLDIDSSFEFDGKSTIVGDWLNEMTKTALSERVIHQEPTCNAPKPVETQDSQAVPCAFYDANQVAVLETEFAKCQQPDDYTIQTLATGLNLTANLVKLWFDIRRVEQASLSTTPFENVGQSSPAPFEFGCYSPSTVVTTTRPNNRRAKNHFQRSQVDALEAAFERSPYPTGVEYAALSLRLRIKNGRIRKWFKNRRSKQKRESGRSQKPPAPSRFAATPCDLVSSTIGNFGSPTTCDFAASISCASAAPVGCDFAPPTCSTFVAIHCDFVPLTNGNFGSPYTCDFAAPISCAFAPSTACVLMSPALPIPRNTSADEFHLTDGKCETLEHLFQLCPKPDYEQVDDLATSTGLTYNTVRSWFKNRRVQQEELKKQRELEQDRMGSYDNTASLNYPRVNWAPQMNYLSHVLLGNFQQTNFYPQNY